MDLRAEQPSQIKIGTMYQTHQHHHNLKNSTASLKTRGITENMPKKIISSPSKQPLQLFVRGVCFLPRRRFRLRVLRTLFL